MSSAALCYSCFFPRFRPVHLPTYKASRVLEFSTFSISGTSSLLPSIGVCTSSRKRLSFLCVREDDSGREVSECNKAEDKLQEHAENYFYEPSTIIKEDLITKLRKIAHEALDLKPWNVPWTAETIVQVMLLWIAAFWLLGSWILPFLVHSAGFRKESFTYRGQALYSLLTDVTEGLTGVAILYHCIARFRPLPPDWFRFSLRGKWHLDVALGCLMFPLVNHLSQVNLNLIPDLPYNPVSLSNVEQSILARDPVAMAIYIVVVSVCAPVWEEIVFRGFLLPSLTKYMPVWCSILVSAVAFALAHFNMQRMLPLVVLGVVMGAIFARSRNLFAPVILHSLWNAFVFLDLMK